MSRALTGSEVAVLEIYSGCVGVKVSVRKPTFKDVLMVLMHSHEVQPLIHLHILVSWYVPVALDPIQRKGDSEGSKFSRYFKSIPLPEIDIASLPILKENVGGLNVAAIPFRLVVIVHVLITTLI